MQSYLTLQEIISGSLYILTVNYVENTLYFCLRILTEEKLLNWGEKTE